MTTSVSTVPETESPYTGLRMTADEFFRLPDDGHNYELVDGIVIMPPSPPLKHQHVAGEIFTQLAMFLQARPIGLAFMETDVHLGQGPSGEDLVYKPDVFFVMAERIPEDGERFVGAPDVVVEVVSPSSRSLDARTKRTDYQRCGVGEYWLIDPGRDEMTCFRRRESGFVSLPMTGELFSSEAIPGFLLNLGRIREAISRWKSRV